MLDHTAEVAILIVGFRNSVDICGCLDALSRIDVKPNFDIFICENGGAGSYKQLVQDLVETQGPCFLEEAQITVDKNNNRFDDIRHLRFRTRSSNVWIGCAKDNLGYAGGINAWLYHLLCVPGWNGIWVLNPDTEPEEHALAALVQRAEVGNKGMVGSTILDAGNPGQIQLRGGLHWQRFAARGIAIGRGDRLDVQPDIPAIEAAMDSPSGASMYVTRSCVQNVGLMDERYFLFFEDFDWGVRAKRLGLGYASNSMVAHKRGSTTGSAESLSMMPRLTVYLEHRNGIHFVRRHFPWALPIRVAISMLYAVRFLIHRSPKNFCTTLEGVFAGLKGEVGRPSWHRKPQGAIR